MSSKKVTSLLPPKRPAKREAGVNVRFTQEEYDELERIADYRDISVTELVYYVVSQFALPQLHEEMEVEIAASREVTSGRAEDHAEQQRSEGSPIASSGNVQPELLPAPVDPKNALGNPVRSGSKSPRPLDRSAPAESSS